MHPVQPRKQLLGVRDASRGSAGSEMAAKATPTTLARVIENEWTSTRWVRELLQRINGVLQCCVLAAVMSVFTEQRHTVVTYHAHLPASMPKLMCCTGAGFIGYP